MKRDFSAEITDLDGEPIRAGMTAEAAMRAINAVLSEIPAETQKKLLEAFDKEASKPLTLAAVCSGALLGAYEDEKNLGDDERIARMELARKVHKGGIVEIEPKDRDRIKPLIKKRWSGILVPVVAAELLEKDVDSTPE